MARLTGRAGLPSTDLYFRNACRRQVASGLGGSRPIRAIGANCFVMGDAMLLIRRDRPAIMRAALEWPGRLAYVVDDDIAGAAESTDLPADYRRRLALFDREFHQPLLVRADLLAVSADPLAALFEADHRIGGQIHRVDPWWSEPLADQRHFARVGVDIVHLGSASHSGALLGIAPLMADLLARHDDLTFTYFAPTPIDDRLEAEPRARRLAPMTWRRYRSWLPRQRFHLGLYPLTTSRFDAARSTNKLFEQHIVGAAGLYPAGWPPARLLGAAGALFAPDDPADWGPALEEAIRRRDELAGIAGRGADAFSVHATPTAQHALWGEFFGIPIGID